MKKLLPIFTLCLFLSIQAQETFNITWMMGISEEDASVTISSGDTVIWTWGDTIPHSVESLDPDAPETFGSEILTGMGQTYEFTFQDPAEIDYRCGIHTTMMTGTITVLPNMSVEDRFIQNLKVYPTNVTDKVNITSLMGLNQYEILNIEGKIVQQGKLSNQNQTSIDLSKFPFGVYFLHLKSTDGISTSIKLIKK